MNQSMRRMRLAFRLARRGYGAVSPNPMVGAVLVKQGRIIGRGWHRQVGGPHAEIEALNDAVRRGHSPRGATLFVTLEPCSTHGRTPPCTEAIMAAGIKRVIVGTVDPNPKHAGRAVTILKRARIAVQLWGALPSRGKRGPAQRSRSTKVGVDEALADECAKLNEAFNHWIVRRVPFVTVKAAMTLDGKIATAAGESKWITSPAARAEGMKLRQGADAILVGINTLLADDPQLTARNSKFKIQNSKLRRIVLDSLARTPLKAKVVSDAQAGLTTIVVSRLAPKRRVAALAKRVSVVIAPFARSKNKTPNIDLRWLLRKLGAEQVTHLLVEGGGEVNASFLLDGLAQRVAFFYAPKILGGRDSLRAVAGDGALGWKDILDLREVEWKPLGPDLFLTARVAGPRSGTVERARH